MTLETQPALTTAGTVPARSVWYVAITDFPKGLGSTARARSICKALRVAGYSTRLLIPYALGHGQNECAAGEEDGVEFQYLNGSTVRPRSALLVALAKLRGNLVLMARVWRSRRDLASVFVYNASLVDCWGVILVCRLVGVRTILDLADEWYDPAIPLRSLGLARCVFQRVAKATEEVVFRGVSRVVVVSRHFECRLARHSGKVVRLPVAFDPGMFASATPERLEPPDAPVVLYAGSVSRTEGVDSLLEAFRAVRQHVPGVRLFVVGNPAHSETIDQYEQSSRSLGLDGWVTFLPAVDQARYASLLRGADLLVIPRPTTVSSQAGFPYKLAEYIASGVPVVVTRFGDVEEYFVDQVHCLMCAPNDAAALASTMVAALNRWPEVRNTAAEGQRHVARLFAYESVAGQLSALVGASDPGSVRR